MKIEKKTLKILSVVVVLGVVVLAVFFMSHSKPELDSEINFLWWGNETHPPAMKESFEKEFGVKINVYDMGSESNMVEALKSGNTDYDVVGVSDIYINELVAAELVSPMDLGNIPNAENLVEQCSERPYNLEEFYMAPIMWLTNGLVFNTKYIPEDTNSWGVLWNSEYAGKIALQDNRNDVIQVALQYIGYPVFAQNRFQLIEAKNFLLNQKPLLRGYENQFVLVEGLVSEELWVGHLSSAMASVAVSANPDLKYVVPKEGSALIPLGFAIPSTSKKKYTAEVFINYLLRSDNNAAIASYDLVAPCVDRAEEFLNKEFLNNPVIYPIEKDLKNLESPADYEVGGEILTEMENIWRELNEDPLI